MLRFLVSFWQARDSPLGSLGERLDRKIRASPIGRPLEIRRDRGHAACFDTA